MMTLAVIQVDSKSVASKETRNTMHSMQLQLIVHQENLWFSQ